MVRNLNTFYGSRSWGFQSAFAERLDGPIIYVGGNISTYATSNDIVHPLDNLTGGIDTKPKIGDVVIHWSSAAMPTMGFFNEPTGYITQNNSATSIGSTVDVAIIAARKYLTANDTTATTVGGTLGAGFGGVFGVQVFRRVDGPGFQNTSSPYTSQNSMLDLAPQVFQTTNADSITVNIGSTITPVTSGAVVCIGAAAGHQSGVRTNSAMGGGLNNVMTAGINTTNDCSMSFGWRYWNTGDGAINPGSSFSFGTSATGQSWCAYRLVLRPKFPS